MMFEKDKGNYFYLGIAISYLVITIIQIKNKQLLTMSLYSSIAWDSLIISFFEMMKSCFQMIDDNIAKMIDMMTRELNDTNNRISIMSKFNELKKDVAEEIKERDELEHNIKQLQKRKKNSRVRKINNTLTCIEIVNVSIIILITSIKNIPNDLLNNKVICILSLFSFSFLMFSFFLKSNNEDPLHRFDDYYEIAKETENEYMDKLEKIAKVRQDDNNRKTL